MLGTVTTAFTVFRQMSISPLATFPLPDLQALRRHVNEKAKSNSPRYGVASKYDFLS